MICPNEVGFFRCIVQSGRTLGWILGDENESFFPADPVGEMLTFIGNTTAYLVERNIVDDFRGTRISILIHEADPNSMGNFEIICDGGEGNICNQTVYVIGGKSLITFASSPGSQKGEGEGNREPGIQRSRMRQLNYNCDGSY